MAGASLLVTLLTTAALVISIEAGNSCLHWAITNIFVTLCIYDKSESIKMQDSLLLPANSSNVACYQLGFISDERTLRFSDQYTYSVEYTLKTIIEEETPEMLCSSWKQQGCLLSTHVITGCIIAVVCIVCTIAFGIYVCIRKYCNWTGDRREDPINIEEGASDPQSTGPTIVGNDLDQLTTFTSAPDEHPSSPQNGQEHCSHGLSVSPSTETVAGNYRAPALQRFADADATSLRSVPSNLSSSCESLASGEEGRSGASGMVLHTNLGANSNSRELHSNSSSDDENQSRVSSPSVISARSEQGHQRQSELVGSYTTGQPCPDSPTNRNHEKGHMTSRASSTSSISAKTEQGHQCSSALVGSYANGQLYSGSPVNRNKMKGDNSPGWLSRTSLASAKSEQGRDQGELAFTLSSYISKPPTVENHLQGSSETSLSAPRDPSSIVQEESTTDVPPPRYAGYRTDAVYENHTAGGPRPCTLGSV